jgi:hypothetical protein
LRSSLDFGHSMANAAALISKWRTQRLWHRSWSSCCRRWSAKIMNTRLCWTW